MCAAVTAVVARTHRLDGVGGGGDDLEGRGDDLVHVHLRLDDHDARPAGLHPERERDVRDGERGDRDLVAEHQLGAGAAGVDLVI